MIIIYPDLDSSSTILLICPYSILLCFLITPLNLDLCLYPFSLIYYIYCFPFSALSTAPAFIPYLKSYITFNSIATIVVPTQSNHIIQINNLTLDFTPCLTLFTMSKHIEQLSTYSKSELLKNKHKILVLRLKLLKNKHKILVLRLKLLEN